MQYDRNSDGTINRASVSLGTAGTPVQLRNVADAVRASDAVNLGQLQSAQAGTLASANAYTDTRINALSFDLSTVAKRAYAGSAAAIALQAFNRQPDRRMRQQVTHSTTLTTSRTIAPCPSNPSETPMNPLRKPSIT